MEKQIERQSVRKVEADIGQDFLQTTEFFDIKRAGPALLRFVE